MTENEKHALRDIGIPRLHADTLELLKGATMHDSDDAAIDAAVAALREIDGLKAERTDWRDKANAATDDAAKLSEEHFRLCAELDKAEAEIDTLRAQLAEARAQVIAEVKALIPSWAGYHFGDSVATDEALSALDTELDALAPAPPGAVLVSSMEDRERALRMAASAGALGHGERCVAVSGIREIDHDQVVLAFSAARAACRLIGLHEEEDK